MSSSSARRQNTPTRSPLLFSSTPTSLARVLEVPDEVRHVVPVRAVLLGDLLQVGEVIRAELVDDSREEVLELLRLVGPRDDVGVGGDARLHLRVREVRHRAVLLEDVHLLDPGDLLEAQTLQRVRQALVVRRLRLVHRLVLPATRKEEDAVAGRRIYDPRSATGDRDVRAIEKRKKRETRGTTPMRGRASSRRTRLIGFLRRRARRARRSSRVAGASSPEWGARDDVRARRGARRGSRTASSAPSAAGSNAGRGVARGAGDARRARASSRWRVKTALGLDPGFAGAPAHRPLPTHADGTRELLELLDVHDG